MQKTDLYRAVISQIDFYRGSYRLFSSILLVMSIVFLLLSIYALNAAWVPHRIDSIITTLDGRLIRPSKVFYRSIGATYFSKGKI